MIMSLKKYSLVYMIKIVIKSLNLRIQNQLKNKTVIQLYEYL